MKIDKNELMLILNVTKEGLKTIEKRQQLYKRLQEKGYELIDRYKEGRKVYYEINQINSLKEVYNNMVKYVYGTNNEKEFSTYFAIRTILNKYNICYGMKEIAERSSVSTKTIRKWDNTLIDKQIISRDGYFYFCIVKDDENNIYKVEPSSIEEYKTFWKNNAYIKAFKKLQDKYYKGEITLTELQLASAEIGAIRQVIDNKYYYRVKKFKTNIENKLYLDTLDLIKNIYGLQNEDNIEIDFDAIDKNELNN